MAAPLPPHSPSTRSGIQKSVPYGTVNPVVGEYPRFVRPRGNSERPAGGWQAVAWSVVGRQADAAHSVRR